MSDEELHNVLEVVIRTLKALKRPLTSAEFEQAGVSLRWLETLAKAGAIGVYVSEPVLYWWKTEYAERLLKESEPIRFVRISDLPPESWEDE